MDGNGRWAKKSLPRSEGHRRGEIIEPLMDAAIALGIKAVSLYAFSTENWLRPPRRFPGLWRLLEFFFREKIDVIHERGIRVKHSGFSDKLPRPPAARFGRPLRRHAATGARAQFLRQLRGARRSFTQSTNGRGKAERESASPPRSWRSGSFPRCSTLIC